MKPNIEILAREAGALQLDAGLMMFDVAELARFATLVRNEALEDAAILAQAATAKTRWAAAGTNGTEVAKCVIARDIRAMKDKP